LQEEEMKKGQVKNFAGSLPYMENFLRRNFFISSHAPRVAEKIAVRGVEALDRSVNCALRASPSGAAIFVTQQMQIYLVNRL